MTDRIEDLLAVHDVMHRYAFAIDTRDWHGLKGLFCAQMSADFRSFGAKAVYRGPADGWVRQVRATIAGMDTTQHQMSNHSYDFEQGRASGTTYIQARHVCRNDWGGDTYTIGGHYSVVMAWHDGAWLIESYTLHCTWHEGDRHVLKAAARRQKAG